MFLSDAAVTASWHENQSQKLQKSVCVLTKKTFFLHFLFRVSDEHGTQCSVDASGQRWTCSTGQSTFSCTVDDSGTRTLCVDEQHCPYAEESQHIHISVYILWTEYFLVENFSKHFYLSEIGECSFVLHMMQCSLLICFSSYLCFHLLLSPSVVKPDKVNIRKVNTTTIKWSYPSSWSSPYSYFPLTFEIAQLSRRCKRCDNPCTDSKATEVRGTDFF